MATAALSWIADEKVILVAVAGAWLYCRLARPTPRARRIADQIALNALMSAIVSVVMPEWIGLIVEGVN